MYQSTDIRLSLGVVSYMAKKSLGEVSQGTYIEEKLRKYQWIDRKGNLTKIGGMVADSCREYHFWVQRGRTAHGQDSFNFMAPSYFCGKDVIELGCGCGTNLLSISESAKSVKGVEITEVYIKMANVICAYEKLPKLNLLHASAENVPLEDSSVDTILCLGALQYTDARKVLKETYRLLRPNGTAIIAVGDFKGFLNGWDSKEAKIRTALRSIVYSFFPRLKKAGSPVYLLEKTLEKTVTSAQLEIAEKHRQFGENWYVLKKLTATG